MVTELTSVYGKNKRSYYGKAVVISNEQGLFLQSYSTIVCGIVNGVFHKYWNDYSSTTAQHIKDFMLQNGLSAMCKKEWDKLETEHAPVGTVNSNYQVTYY